MSSKTPLTEYTVAFDSMTADVTSDYSGLGEPTIQLVQWKRRPYATVGDLYYDAKPPATCQRISTPQQGASCTYEDGKLTKNIVIYAKKDIGEARSQMRLKSFVYIGGFITVLAFLLACGGIALTILEVTVD